MRSWRATPTRSPAGLRQPRDLGGQIPQWPSRDRALAFVDIEIDHPDLKSACFGFPPLAAGHAAGQGPSQDCVMDKIEEFAAELQSPAASPPERLLALKFLMHFVGDPHQPLHASDHNDRGGNCIGLSPSPDGHAKNLHAYWDTGVVEPLGSSAQDIAAKLNGEIAPAQARA